VSLESCQVIVGIKEFRGNLETAFLYNLLPHPHREN
jgi:hypothetical protein